MPVLKFGKSNISKLKQKSGIPGPAKFKSKSSIPRPKQINRPDFAHDVQAAEGKSRTKIVLPQRVLVNRQGTRKPLLPLQSPAPERILIKSKFQSPAVREIASKKVQPLKKVPSTPVVRVLKIATPTPCRVPRKNANKKSIHWADESSPIVQDKLARHLFGEQTKMGPTSILKTRKKVLQCGRPTRMKNVTQHSDDELNIEIVSPTTLNSETPLTSKPTILTPKSPPRTPAPTLKQSGEILTPIEPSFTPDESKENLLRPIEKIKKISPARISSALTQQKLASSVAMTKEKIIPHNTMAQQKNNSSEVMTKEKIVPPNTMTQQKIALMEDMTKEKTVPPKMVTHQKTVLPQPMTQQSHLPKMLKAEDVVKMMTQQLRQVKRKSVQNIFSGMISQLTDNLNLCDVIEEDNEKVQKEDSSSQSDDPVTKVTLSPIAKERMSFNAAESLTQCHQTRLENKENTPPQTSHESFSKRLDELREETRLWESQYLGNKQRVKEIYENLNRKEKRTYHNILSQENQVDAGIIEQKEDKVGIGQPLNIQEDATSSSWDLELRKENNHNVNTAEVEPVSNNNNNNVIFNPFSKQQTVFAPPLKIAQPKPLRIKPPKQKFTRPRSRPSSRTLKNRLSQHYAKMLLDDEVTLLTCRIRGQTISTNEKTSDPVADVLSNGDLTHFVPIIPTPSATPQRTTKPHGSAFSNCRN